MGVSAIQVDVELQLIEDRELRLTATVHNGLDRDLRAWSLQFDLPKAVGAGADTVLCSQVGSHVSLSPADDGVHLPSGSSTDLSCLGAAGMIQRLSDLPSGFYVRYIDSDGQTQILPAVLGEHNLTAIVDGTLRPSAYGDQPTPASVPTPPTLSATTVGTKAPALDKAGPTDLVPRPRHIRWSEGEFSCDTLLQYSGPGAANAAVTWLTTQVPLELRRSDEETAHLRFLADDTLPAEAYRLRIEPDVITIGASREAGFFYGVVSLVQLAVISGSCLQLACVDIEDEPRFGYRGLMLDCARHFHSKETLLRLLDLMALYKLNGFHWHLTDDEGWRVEILAFPELTERGAWRGEGEVLEPQFGSGPGRYGGYYTQQDVREIVAYATARQIQVIPEIDIPGHSRAAIKCCPELLVEGADESTYCGAQMYDDNVLNPALPGTYRFLHQVLDEICGLFPGPWIHVGADEVPAGVWEGSPACQQFMAEHGYDSPHQLQGHLLHDLQAYLADRSRCLMGWEEVVHGDKLDRSAIVNAWSGIDVGTELANVGYGVVACPAPFAYLDLAWNADPSEPGYYWAGTSDLASCYAYEPHTEGLTEEGAARLLGVQAVLWSELLDSREQLDYMLFPRLLAMAETAWTSQHGKDFDDFSARLPLQLRMLQRLGVNYRPMDTT